MGALTRAADFVKAFALGFQVEVSVTEIILSIHIQTDVFKTWIQISKMLYIDWSGW